MMTPASPLPPATAFHRLCAWVFDTSLAVVPATLIGWILTASGRRALEARQERALETLQAGMAYLHDLVFLYVQQGMWTLFWVVVFYGVGSVLAEGGIQQATWGKRLMGISVEAMPGQNEDYRAAAVRFSAGGLSWASLNIGHAMIRWRTDRRALHDLVAGMRVVVEPMDAAKRRYGALACWATWVGVNLLLLLLTPSDPVAADVLRQATEAAMVGGVISG